MKKCFFCNVHVIPGPALILKVEFKPNLSASKCFTGEDLSGACQKGVQKFCSAAQLLVKRGSYRLKKGIFLISNDTVSLAT